jgi:ketosteroid isomerase-like protein
MNHMYLITLWLIAAPLVHAVSATQEDGPGTPEVRRLESIWNDAHLRGDADAMDRLCPDDLVVTVPGMRLMTKAESVGVLRSGRMKFDRYETSDVRVRVYGDAAVVTGRLQRTRTIAGKSMDDDWRFTKTYVKRSGQWQVVAFHASTNAQYKSAGAVGRWWYLGSPPASSTPSKASVD